MFSLEITPICPDKEEKKGKRGGRDEAGRVVTTEWNTSWPHKARPCFGFPCGSQGTCCHHRDDFHSITKKVSSAWQPTGGQKWASTSRKKLGTQEMTDACFSSSLNSSEGSFFLLIKHSHVLTYSFPFKIRCTGNRLEPAYFPLRKMAVFRKQQGGQWQLAAESAAREGGMHTGRQGGKGSAPARGPELGLKDHGAQCRQNRERQAPLSWGTSLLKALAASIHSPSTLTVYISP